MSNRLLVIEKKPSGSIGLKKAKELGDYIIFIGSKKCYNKVSDNDLLYIDEFSEADTNDDELVINMVEHINVKKKIQGVITFMEFYVPLAAKVAETLGLKGITYENALKERNKHLMRESFRQKNIPIPKYALISNVDSAKNDFVHFDVNVGEHIESLKNSSQRLGYAIACGVTAEQAEFESRHLKESVIIEIESE
ncbi:hypothetical protein [Photorhabdus luminescens]|uniref:BL00235/CARNS1 N-terminal domain-containing protein n=1 Tax=Photorhabdus luminescens subsp. mexicana TaxID=2100167 RepID=A0A4R4IU77_PHOLU|nr:hypothetical protein [Photorhabdus luminescens]TDB44071.1 hypothetical protein C5468_23190 [Photorhabdus luminescens subsp. mexicana]